MQNNLTDKAKALLVKKYGITEADADRYIQRIAANGYMSQLEAARQIIESFTCDTPKEDDR